MPTEHKQPSHNWNPVFPLDTLKRMRAQSLKNLVEPPSLEDAERILAEAFPPPKPANPNWLRRCFARFAEG